jgi:hypothetical protein
VPAARVIPGPKDYHPSARPADEMTLAQWAAQFSARTRPRRRYSRAMKALFYLILALALAPALVPPAAAQGAPAPVHGLWVWKSTSVLEAPQGIQALGHFCRSARITEVYVSVPARYSASEERQLAQLIALLHASSIRVEALVSSITGDVAGAPRDKVLSHVQAILQFNRRHPAQRFDGIHLDIEPQQRAENKGPGNLGFLPGLVETYRAVRTLTDGARLTLNADIQNKLLKGDAEQRRSLLASLPRTTLMLYELSRPDDGTALAEKTAILRQAGEKFLDMAYQGLEEPDLAKMSIALRTPDYGPQLPEMLASLDAAFLGNPHYLGWARHSYNDVLAEPAVSGAP